MKISPRSLSWSNLSRQLESFLPQKETSQPAKRRTRGNNAFLAWGSHNPRSLRDQKLEKPLHVVDLKLLMGVYDSSFTENLSYHGFISSHLQHGPIDDQSNRAIKRSIAIKRMLALVTTTIEDMRKIELNHISQSKG